MSHFAARKTVKTLPVIRAARFRTGQSVLKVVYKVAIFDFGSDKRRSITARESAVRKRFVGTTREAVALLRTYRPSKRRLPACHHVDALRRESGKYQPFTVLVETNLLADFNVSSVSILPQISIFCSTEKYQR